MKKIIIGSFLLAVLHSILFYGKQLGVSVLLFAIPTVFLLIELLKKKGLIKNQKALYIAIPILMLSSTYLIFDNVFFNTLNLIVIPFLIASMIVWATMDMVTLRALFGKAISLIVGSLEFMPNAIRAVKHVLKLERKDKQTKYHKVKLIFIGILCSIPLLFVILGLLVSADGLFAEIFGKIFQNLEYLLTAEVFLNFLGRAIIIVAVTIYIICVVYNLSNKNTTYNYSKDIKDIFKVNIDKTIINTVLTLINIVYLLFSGIQIMYVVYYLFGKVDIGINLAQYARQGFFQLMFITFINFVVILFVNVNRNENEDKDKRNKYTTFMNLLMCIFTIIIGLSAVVRMYLYEREYGYTFLRLMVYFILATELIMMIPTIIYVIKGKVSLLKSYFIIGTVMYLVVNFSNIDYIIAKNNVDRALKLSEGVIVRKIDVKYLTNNLGGNAISQMLRLYEYIEDEDDKRRINNYLYNQYIQVEEENTWQSFNITKANTKSLLKGLDLKYQQKTYYNNNNYHNKNYKTDNAYYNYNI